MNKIYRWLLLFSTLIMTNLHGQEIDFAKKFYEKYGDESAIIYSLWEGYVERDHELKALREQWGERFIPLHSGGHASIDTLERTLAICANEQTTIIPMHVNATEDFRRIAKKAMLSQCTREGVCKYRVF